MTEDGKERKVNIDFEPFKSINTSLYLCDNKFHVEALGELLEDDQIFGYYFLLSHNQTCTIYPYSQLPHFISLKGLS